MVWGCVEEVHPQSGQGSHHHQGYNKAPVFTPSPPALALSLHTKRVTGIERAEEEQKELLKLRRSWGEGDYINISTPWQLSVVLPASSVT